LSLFFQSIEWRRDVKFDEALTWDIPDKIHESFPFYIDGVDKDGRRVFYFPSGRWEVRMMITNGWRSMMEKTIYYTMASIMKAIDGDKGGHEQFVIIIDLAEMTYWKIAHYETMQMILQVFREYEQNFPERLFKAVVINAPWVLNCVYPLVKPLLKGSTLQKVEIFGNDPKQFMPAILDVVTKENLPSGFRENNPDCIEIEN